MNPNWFQETWLGEHLGQIIIAIAVAVAIAIVSYHYGQAIAIGSAWLHKVEHHDRYETIVMEFDGQLHDYTWFYSDNK